MARCRIAVAACALAANLGLSLSAHAQYRPPQPLPEPLPPSEPVPSPTPGAEGQVTPQRIQVPVRRIGWSWEPGLVLDAGWEENIGFTRPPGPDDTFGALSASLARVRRGDRSEFRLAVSGTGYLYRELSEWNRADGFARVSALGPLSPRVEGRMSGSYGYAHTDSEDALIADGVILPLDRTRTTGATAGLTWRSAERTSLVLGGSWYLTDFESDRYLDTTDWIGTITLKHQVSRRDDISLTGRYETTRDDLSTRQNPAYYVGYGHLFGRSLQLGLSAGIAREEGKSVEGGASFEPSWSFSGSAGLSGRIRRASLSFRYYRGPRPRIGLGTTVLTDSFTLGVTIPMGRRLELLGNGTYALRGGSVDPGASRSRDWDAYIGASTRLSSQLRMVLGYRFRRREDSREPLGNDRASVSLVWGNRERWN